MPKAVVGSGGYQQTYPPTVVPTEAERSEA
jgi:hypothetical protein